MKNILVVLFIASISLASTCKKNCTGNEYAFSVSMKAFPNKDSINIGDTLFFEVKDSTYLKDISTNKWVDFSQATNLSTPISIGKFISENPIKIQDDALNKFNLGLAIGGQTTSVNPNKFVEYLLKETSGKYLLQFYIVAKEKGKYFILIPSAKNVFRNGSCDKASFIFEFNKTGTNQFGYLYPSGASVTPSGGSYYFVVK